MSNPTLSESLVFTPSLKTPDGQEVPQPPTNAALAESIVFAPTAAPQSQNKEIETVSSPISIDGADKKGEEEEEGEEIEPTSTTTNNSNNIEIEEDKEHSAKIKDGILGDVVDNEKIISHSLDSDVAEEDGLKKSEINTKQVLRNPSFNEENNSNQNNNINNDENNETNSNNINNENNENKPTTTTTTTTTTTSTTNHNDEKENQVSFDNQVEKFDPNTSVYEDIKASGSSVDSPNRVRLNTSQRLKMMKQKSEKRLSHRPKSIKLEHKKNVLGEIIYKGHPSWALMLNIQTGIRNAVGKSMGTDGAPNNKTPQQYHTLRKPSEFRNQKDFYASPKTLRFDSAGSAMTNAHSTGPFKFKDYCPNAFRYLRYLFGIDTADFMVSLCNTLKNGENALRELPTPGKSGSLFFFSHDMKFIIKTIPKDEARLLRDILPEYLEHIEANPNSLLPRFFGLYRVKPHSGRQVRFVVMGNLFPTKKKIHERYDLKGSVVGREASVEERKSESVTFKDIDFRNRKHKIYLGPTKKQSFVDQIKKDCKLLQKLNIMDYSLLIGIHYPHREEQPSPSLLRSTLEDSSDCEQSPSIEPRNKENGRSKREKHYSMDNETYISAFQQDEGGIKSQGGDSEEHYFLGIIDILMLYSLRKKVEHTYKTIRFGTKQEISSVEPEEYSERFQEFLSTIVE
ncbi:hypothetical protein DICPUDRAFT_55653 [Dictyostelium purpureum]|uniref:PIPK domain-containing protein n=1 Tax=Dictyostelium purpureum TaxID=5786 RepID=F0ZN35_DICPU|nr:uncharacterized protein DICPUDRAFT_55653 [Dictyostelium purpureum]EGC34645.1 hypothetical protein DICPUDRAFT_55653 [Dictyostelium purpureum]|eukprot:XP_003288826.1 hypothetical protein DICPUDRAFT_55653 [Dictyostelium purpureum]